MSEPFTVNTQAKILAVVADFPATVDTIADWLGTDVRNDRLEHEIRALIQSGQIAFDINTGMFRSI
jgi:hypothetical protein